MTALSSQPAIRRVATSCIVCLTAALGAAPFEGRSGAAEPSTWRLATFSADVTPPLGHPLLAGATTAPPASRIDDPLFARGFVLFGGDRPLVVAAVDWCEIRNEAHDRWREALAQAAGTDRDRVLVTSLHQHDAPLPDPEAERILRRQGAAARTFDLEFHERAVQSVAAALRAALPAARPVTHIGLGRAEVREVASNRRYLDAEGRPRHDRSSMSGGLSAQRDAPPGTIDPWLRTLSFWDGETPHCALSVFAVHPMSYWGTGWVTSDFPGLARARRQADDPQVFQIYASGASGNVTAGKYNDGRHENRPVLVSRLHAAMREAWEATRKVAIGTVTFRSAPLRLEPRDDPGFTVADLNRRLSRDDSRQQALGAMGLSWRKRADAGHILDVPCIDFGPAQLLLLPGESYVEHQLYAQDQRPDSFVVVMGYGECAPGYVPTERAWAENDRNLDEWCWTTRGAEQFLRTAIRRALGNGDDASP